MSKVEGIENEIKHLSREELADLREWFIKFDEAEWDRQIESDIEAGKLDQLAATAVDSHRRGNSHEL